jgi:hypothetical protein
MKRRGWTALVMVLVALVAVSAQGHQRPIASVEVVSLVSRSTWDPADFLRKSLERQLARVDWSKAQDRGPFVLSTSLVRLDTRTSDDAAKVSCVVSMMLRDQKQGTVRALVENTARTQDSSQAVLSAEHDALDAAVRGAVRSLPEAMRRR